MSAETLSICIECSAVVFDLKRHEAWHRSDIMLERNAKRMLWYLWKNRGREVR